MVARAAETITAIIRSSDLDIYVLFNGKNCSDLKLFSCILIFLWMEYSYEHPVTGTSDVL